MKRDGVQIVCVCVFWGRGWWCGMRNRFGGVLEYGLQAEDLRGRTNVEFWGCAGIQMYVGVVGLWAGIS